MQYLTFKTRDSFGRDLDSLLGDLWGARSEVASPAWAPQTEIEEQEDHFLVSLDTPGMKRSDLNIEVHENRLVVSGERRRYGKFQRSFTLPNVADTSKIEAQYEDGVLQVYVPKAEAAKPRQVKIGDGQQPGIFSKLLGQKNKETAEIAS